MERRFVLIQGAAGIDDTLFLKVFFAKSSNSVSVSNGVELQTVSVPPYYNFGDDSIASTGPNPGDWSISFHPEVGDDPLAVGFVSPSNTIIHRDDDDVPRVNQRPGPHFFAADRVILTGSFPTFGYAPEWLSPLGSGVHPTIIESPSEFGYVLPDILSGDRLINTGSGSLKDYMMVASDYSHSLFISNVTSGPPWICDSSGNFWRAPDTLSNVIFNDPHALLGLTWPYLYRNTSFTRSDIFWGGEPGIRLVSVSRFNLETGNEDFVTVQAFDPGGSIGNVGWLRASV